MMMHRLFNKKKEAGISVLVLVAIYMVWHNAVSPYLDRSSNSFEEAVENMLSVDEASEEIQIGAMETVHENNPMVDKQALFWNDTIVRDPFRPEPRIEKSQLANISKLRLERVKKRPSRRVATKKTHKQPVMTVPVMTGLVAGQDTQYAVINGQIISEGQTVKGYRVVDISPQGVQLINPGGAMVMLTMGYE